jgi:hypothetical protein
MVGRAHRLGATGGTPALQFDLRHVFGLTAR